MTEILSGFAQARLGRSAIDTMSNNAEHQWRQQYFDQMPLLNGHWAQPQASHMSGMQELDLRMFQHETPQYTHSYSTGQAPMVSHNLHFNHEYLSDIDTGTPSTSGFPTGVGDPYSNQPPPRSSFLQPPQRTHRNSGPNHSPRSSVGAVSPPEAPMNSPQLMRVDERPPIGRSVTAPEQLERRSTASGNNLSTLKRSGSSEEDDDYVPTQDTKSQRGRKRHRIPHTAVERRYRENLNAHLDKLRQTVPSLAARDGLGGKDGEGARPSKCETEQVRDLEWSD